MSNAYIFPGQGAQFPGMGQELYETHAKAREYMDQANDILGFDIKSIMFSGTKEELQQTGVTQTAIFIHSVLAALTSENFAPDMVAGHSLGEYSALCASESLSLEETAKLLKVRATSMQEASPKGEGAMAACIGVSFKDLNDVLDSLVTDGVCQIANDNVEGQIVISGHEYNVDRVVATLKDTGHKAIKLKVSAPFHSQLVEKASKPMQNALDSVEIKAPKTPLLANVTADLVSDPTIIKQNLVSQISGTVRWRETMDKFAELGITELVEIGSGKVLAGLAKKSPHNFKLKNISNIEELGNYLAS